MTDRRRLRILIGKAGLDGHDRGVKIIARALRDAGFEVIYTGLHNTPEAIVETALQEDVDAVGLSILSGAHNFIFPEIIRLFDEKGVRDITIFGGGIIPAEDVESLKEKGVKAVFEPGARTDEIIAWVRENVSPRAL
ncbi:MAG: cobalamin B12-binding domain-containing protein [Deltaproteobacteria bacterium]